MSEVTQSPSTKVSPAIVWFRDDLRLGDNPALSAAVASGLPLLLVYIWDEHNKEVRQLGGASKWWLHGSLNSLCASISPRGGNLQLFVGDTKTTILELAKASGATEVYWNRRYGEAEVELDKHIKEQLKLAGITTKSFNGQLLNEPWEVSTKAGTPMKVFTPYWRAARERGEPARPTPAPQKLIPFATPALKSVPLEALNLKPTKPDWSGEMQAFWKPGEDHAKQSVERFLSDAVDGYGENRNRPDKRSTSRLSPHLRFGEISPRQIWHATRTAFENGNTVGKEYDVDKFLTEIGWREFSYHLLFHFPKLRSANFQSKFNAFPWKTDPKALLAWQQGKTGYPIVDAGMRELWRTGWMHNRVRMIVGSFLVKHLLIDWRQGEDWFWDTLVDADPASNAASWQWIAGSGADAAPYFRIFAPVIQGEKFDPNGDYVRHYVPELARLPKQVIHKPWTAPHPILTKAGITLGIDYPHPIVVHEDARKRALAAFKSISAEQISDDQH